MTKLLTLGCSWMEGVGAMYVPKVHKTSQLYSDVSHNRELMAKYSFRTILSKKYGFENVNLGKGGASNGSMFRRLLTYLRKNTLDDTIVLWGITSIYRMELFFNHSKGFSSFQPTQRSKANLHGPDWVGPKEYFRQHFDEKVQLNHMIREICHWRHYFELLGVPQLWFHTLNYPGIDWRKKDAFRNFVKLPYPCNNDLLSQLAYHNGWNPKDDKYHFSDWKADCDRIAHLKKRKIVNPYSFHPTLEGHKQIADILDAAVNNCYTNYKGV